MCRRRQLSPRTEESYRHWIRRFILFHDKRHPKEMGAPEVAGFLNDLAVNRQVAASTQSQALNAIVFLYDSVLGQASVNSSLGQAAWRNIKPLICIASFLDMSA